LWQHELDLVGEVRFIHVVQTEEQVVEYWVLEEDFAYGVDPL
jgi:hypothetical protein